MGTELVARAAPSKSEGAPMISDITRPSTWKMVAVTTPICGEPGFQRKASIWER
jgi:hypothetical protein